MTWEFKIFDPPPAELRPYVYWSFSLKGELPVQSLKVLPAGLAVMLFLRGDSETAGFFDDADRNRRYENGWVYGIYTWPVFHSAGFADAFGVRLEPIGLHILFGIDMRTLADKIVDPEESLPADFLAEIDQMRDISHTQAGHDEINKILMRRLKRPLEPWLLDFYREIKATYGTLVLGDAYERTGRSPKYVIERFKRAVGVSPKNFGGILRLDALLRDLDPEKDVNWADLAQGFGFYDQSHFNRAFKRLSGLTPGEYLHMRRHGPMPMPKQNFQSIVAEK